MNKRREIKRLAEKAVGEMIELLYKHMNPVGSLCIQISTNELPKDQIPILHIANSEVVIDGTIHSLPVRYTLAPEYFGKNIRNRMLSALRQKQLEADAEESSAQKFINILKERGVDKSITFLEETGFSSDGIKRVLTAVLDKIQKHEDKINGNLRSPSEDIPTPSEPPRPAPNAPRFSRSEEIQVRQDINRNRVSDVIDELDRIINSDLSEMTTRGDDLLDIEPQYANNQQVQACRVIRSCFDDISTIGFLGYSQKLDITNLAREQNISEDVTRSMIAMFNVVRQLGQRHNRLSTNHREQAKGLVHYMFGNEVMINAHEAGKITKCGELIGIYTPYIIEEIAVHNARAYDLNPEQTEEVDTVSDEDLQAAADVYDRNIEQERQRQLYEDMEERRRRDERGDIVNLDLNITVEDIPAPQPEVTITSETVLNGTMQRIDIDDAALRLFAHVTGTTNNNIDSIGPIIGPALTEELYESADRNNIPRNSMRWAILTYDQIHENESMDGYEEEQSRQSDVFIDLNYNADEIINDTDRILMIDRARFLGIDTEIFALSIDAHNRVLQENSAQN